MSRWKRGGAPLPDHLLIDGQLTHGAGQLLVVNPATEEPLGVATRPRQAQADDAVCGPPQHVENSRSIAYAELRLTLTRCTTSMPSSATSYTTFWK